MACTPTSLAKLGGDCMQRSIFQSLAVGVGLGLFVAVGPAAAQVPPVNTSPPPAAPQVSAPTTVNVSTSNPASGTASSSPKSTAPTTVNVSTGGAGTTTANAGTSGANAAPTPPTAPPAPAAVAGAAQIVPVVTAPTSVEADV